MPPQMIGDELCYTLPLPEENVQSAFDMGLAPFCPMRRDDKGLPWYPGYKIAQVRLDV